MRRLSIVESVLVIPTKAMIDGKIEIAGLYKSCTMLFREFAGYYDAVVRLKRLPPLEKLTVEEKQMLWDFSKTISEDHNERVKICKVSYVIDYMVTEFF